MDVISVKNLGMKFLLYIAEPTGLDRVVISYSGITEKLGA